MCQRAIMRRQPAVDFIATEKNLSICFLCIRVAKGFQEYSTTKILYLESFPKGEILSKFDPILRKIWKILDFYFNTYWNIRLQTVRLGTSNNWSLQQMFQLGGLQIWHFASFITGSQISFTFLQNSYVTRFC